MVRPLVAISIAAGIAATMVSVVALDASAAADRPTSPSTTAVRPGDAPGESIIDFGDGEVLSPPLQIEEPTSVLGTVVERSDGEVAPDSLARTGGSLAPITLVGLLLVATGAVLCLRARPELSAREAVELPRSELSIRWLEMRPVGASTASRAGSLTLRFLPSDSTAEASA